MDVEKRNSEIRAAFHAAGIKGRGIVFDVLDSGAVKVSTMKPVNMTPNVVGDKADHGTKVAWLLHEACPEAEIRSYYCSTGKHIMTALQSVLDHVRAEPDKQHIVNVSMVGSETDGMEELIDQLTAMNVPVVCAAGNDGEERLNRFPSCYQSPYTASAIQKDGSKCDFSTWHDEVDFCELGKSVQTRRADQATIKQSGTSFSSPILAGKIGLLHCEAMRKRKRLTDAELYERLKAGAVDLGTDGRDPYFGWGYVEIMPQAVEAEPEPEEEPRESVPVVSAAGLVEWCKLQLDQIYVWGGNGQEATPAKIKSMETSTINANRAMALYEKRLAEGLDPIVMYDCSGLISRYLQNNGIVDKKRNCDHLADMCFVHTSRNDGEMEPGDLLFRWKSGEEQYYHVGVYVGIIDGERWVIESKGRDDGVVMRKINASGSSYWNRWGRLAVFAGEQPVTPKEPEAPTGATVLKVTTPYMRGDAIKQLQQALNALGYPCGDADGICGKNTMAGVNAFVAAHGSGELPESIKAYVTINGREYIGELEG